MQMNYVASMGCGVVVIEQPSAGYPVFGFFSLNVKLYCCYVQRWMAFQVLHALKQCHDEQVCHGDVKCENILVTSWNWVLLTDFASYKPVYLPADNPVSA